MVLLLTLILHYTVMVSKPMHHPFRTVVHHIHRSCDVWRSGIVLLVDNLGMADIVWYL